MRLKLENIGIISKSDINLNGITLITGENDSGKSTVGKVLYSIIRALNNNEDNFNASKDNFIKKSLTEIFNLLQRAKTTNKDDSKIIDEIISSVSNEYLSIYRNSIIEIDKMNSLNFDFLDKKLSKQSNNSLRESIIKIVRDTEDRKNISLNSTKFLNFELTEYFNSEFGNTIKNAFNEEDSSIEISSNIENYSFSVLKNQVELDKVPINFPYKDVIFIESPLFIDEKKTDSNFNLLRDKKNYLNFKINRKEKEKEKTIFTDNSNEIEAFNSMILNTINGSFSYNNKNQIIFKKDKVEFSLSSVATGIKTFGAIQLLLENDNLNSETLLVVDEPEVHLHPTWQVKYAEILVKLSKQFSIPMVLTSHSPYFIEAIEVFSKKHDYSDSTDFYFAKKEKNGLSSEIFNINDNLFPILDSISSAYYEIQDLKDEL